MNAREKFGCDATATVSEVKKQWQKKALQHHPDQGDGDVLKFLKSKTQYFAALKESLTPIPCSVCKGTKRIKKTSGFSSIEVDCPRCK